MPQIAIQKLFDVNSASNRKRANSEGDKRVRLVIFKYMDLRLDTEFARNFKDVFSHGALLSLYS